MGKVKNLLERLGFVRLEDFGLLLTSDRRVVMTRSRVLDDGYGERVVGWAETDLAAMELATWGADAAPRPKPGPAPKLVSAPPTPRPVTVAPPAPRTEPEEDEWEWEIAVARARASEAVAPAPSGPVPLPVVKPPRSGPHTVPRWLTQEPLTGSWSEDTAIRSTEKLVAESRPRTIIPVPAMPVVDPRLVRARTEPAPRRFPRASIQPISARNEDLTSPTAIVIPRQAARR